MTSTTTDVASVERHDPHCIDPDRLPAVLAGAPWRRFLVMGDSIAAGDGDPVEGYDPRSWAERLAAALLTVDPTTAYANLGVRGLVAHEIRARQLDDALAFGPDLAVVSAGANDMLRRSFHAEDVEDDVEGIVGALATSGCLVVTFGLLDLSRTSFVPDAMRDGLRQRTLALNGLVRRATERHGGVHVDFFDHPAVGDELFSADMIHPNRRGHACIVASLARALAARIGLQALGKAGEGGGKGRPGGWIP